MSVLDNYQQKLVKHFTQLSKERDGTVFLLEHPLSTENINEIKSFIHSFHIDVQSLIENYYAILLVLLTETGYYYAGNGTDFWNKFENDWELATITNTERLQIRNKFKNQQLFWHIAKPFDTNWANQFSIIANPIVNAVLPLDIRFPLMETLRAIPIRYFEETRETKSILSFIQKFSPDSYSSRYKNWLQSFPFVDDFVLALTLENEIPHLIKTETLNRIRYDWVNDKIVGKSLQDFRKKYHQGQKLQPLTKTTASTKEFESKRIYKCNLFLKYESNKWTLNGQLHIKFLECIVHNPDLKRKLQSGQWLPKAWNCFSVKPAAFLQQELFEIPPIYWNKINIDTPFIKPPEDCLSTIRDAVDAIRFNIDCPAIFKPVTDMESTAQYKQCSAKITANTGFYICVLHEKDTNIIEGISLDYSINGYYIFRINTDQTLALDWAKSHGIEVKQPSPWNWIAPLGHIDHNKKLISVLPSDKFFLNIKNNAEIQIQFNNEPAQNVSGIIAFESGNYSIVIVDDNLKEEWKVIVVEQEETLPFFSAELIGEPTVSQLKKQALSITFDSIHSFKNVNCRISLTNKSNEKSIFYSDLLENFNETFTYTRLFSQAFEENESEFKNNFWSLVNSQKDLQLELDIQGVFRKQWMLESVLNGIWWEEINTNSPIAKSDDEEYNVQEILHQERYPLYPADCQIYRAIKKGDNPVPVYRAETILRCQSKLELGGNILKTPERIIRRNKDTKNSVGLANIIDDMLAFRQAQTTNAVEEMIRCKIIEELESIFWTITCGKIWTDTFITQKSVVYYLKQWIYPPQIADELYSQKKSLQTPVDVLDTFDRYKTNLLRQSPYSEFWKIEQVVNNFSYLFYYPSKFDYAFKEQTIQTALLDRQLLRIFSFLVLLQKENKREI
ncbi:MAG: hypothetical protein LBT05_12865 [Planctomycetaceae bacterium]|jgi:hypothetical protein|nr:hypothetical protein [Planctomycetaceae bacterium]